MTGHMTHLQPAVDVVVGRVAGSKSRDEFVEDGRRQDLLLQQEFQLLNQKNRFQKPVSQLK